MSSQTQAHLHNFCFEFSSATEIVLQFNFCLDKKLRLECVQSLQFKTIDTNLKIYTEKLNFSPIKERVPFSNKIYDRTFSINFRITTKMTIIVCV